MAIELLSTNAASHAYGADGPLALVFGYLWLLNQATPVAPAETISQLFSSSLGTPSAITQNGLSGGLTLVQADISTHAAGNTATAADITKAWTVPANDGQEGTAYTIKCRVAVNTGQTTAETLTLGVDINGTQTAIATLGAAFNSGALNTAYDIPVELTVVVDAVGANTPEIYLNGPLGDTGANRLSTNSANMSGHVNTATFNKANTNTIALYAQWGGAGGSDQTAGTLSSRFYREGP